MKASNTFWQTVCLYDDFAARVKKSTSKAELKDNYASKVTIDSLAKQLSDEVDDLKHMHGARRNCRAQGPLCDLAASS